MKKFLLLICFAGASAFGQKFDSLALDTADGLEQLEQIRRAM